MQTLTLKVDESVSEKLLWLLSHFKKEEIEIVDNSFLETKEYLEKELEEIDSGSAKMISVDELESRLDSVIEKYDN